MGKDARRRGAGPAHPALGLADARERDEDAVACAALGAEPGGNWEATPNVRAYVLAPGGSGGSERPEPETQLGPGPGRGRCERPPSGSSGRGRSRGGRDWSRAREPGGRSQGLGVGGGAALRRRGGAGTPGRSAAAITDFLWDKRTGLAARTVSARAGGPRGRAGRWRPRGGRGRGVSGARDRGEVRGGRGSRPAKWRR